MRRALPRGLMLTLILSGLNLVGAFLTLTAAGGLQAWSPWQFVGLFGTLETGMGLAAVVAPNIWRFPVAEASTSDRTEVRLTAEVALRPHWVALSKAAAGASMVVVAAAHEGVSLQTLLLPVPILAVATITIALSLLVARYGVARPDLDVLWVTFRMPGRREVELPGISLAAAVVQFLVNVAFFPTVRLLSPDELFRPELAPSGPLTLVLSSIAMLCLAAAYVGWRDRLARRTPVEQVIEADRAQA